VGAFHSLLHGGSLSARGAKGHPGIFKALKRLVDFADLMNAGLRIVDTRCIPECMSEPILSAEEMDKDAVAFPHLNEEEMAAALKCGRLERFEAGHMVFEVGDCRSDFYVIVSGSVEVIAVIDGKQHVLVVHRPGGFLGNINIFTQRPSDVGCRACGATEVIRLGRDEVRRLAIISAGVGEKWMEAILRRSELVNARGVEGLRVLGGHLCPATLELREFFYRNGVPHRWIDTDDEANAPVIAEIERESHGGPLLFPVIARVNKVLMQRPALEAVADRVGIHRTIEDKVFDTVIIGCGPAGLGAAVYAASEGLQTLVLDRVGPGGQAGASSRIENYTGFPAGLTGHELAMRSYLQALKFGAEFSAPCDVAAVRCLSGELHQVDMADGSVVKTKTVIVATGVSYRMLDVRGLRALRGSGVYFAATQVEALMCDKRPVHVIGAGNSAGQAAMFLSKQNENVNLVVRGGDLRKSMSSYLSERVALNPRIRVRLQTELRGIEGTRELEKVHLECTATGEKTVEESCGVFVFIGATPCTGFLGEGFLKDEKGFIITGAEVVAAGRWKHQNRIPCSLETSCAGVFAAGDCRAYTPKRVAFAVGDGALAVSCVHDFLGTYD
jgi:thioredoxin reductase (NADPH)